MATQRDLSLVYSPGVALPVAANPATSYDYAAKGNLGALASKPVMKGKAVLLKRFADVDAIDLELATEDVDAFVNAVALLEPSLGDINLEDIAAPPCFVIETDLRERTNIPMVHDDQHGTAIITPAGLLNTCCLTNRSVRDLKLVFDGTGAAALACTDLMLWVGVTKSTLVMCGRLGRSIRAAPRIWINESPPTPRQHPPAPWRRH